MNNDINQKNAVAAIRISSLKQGLQGDSPEAQREQIERFASNHNIHIKKYFVFMESASKEQQPIQEAIDYCKNPKNDIQLFIIKSIDRFTRGGSYLYDMMKMQLTEYKVQLVDIYGIIGAQQVNTLEHLGIKFNWSVYSPTKKAEILEAERAKDEMRDIMTRMIGAEIRYVRMGYRVRTSPIGYVNKKIDTPHGQRVILVPHEQEALWIRQMFELRMRSNLTDQQIVDEINSMGFQTRIRNRRSSQDKKKVIGTVGGNKLTIQKYWRYIQKPIYAGIMDERWTQGQPVKARFDGLVSIDTFNKANRGKITIIEENGQVTIHNRLPPEYLLKKGARNPDFPYKRYVMCPECAKPLFGSASRGKSGKYYPAYHCNKRGHYFRVAKKDFNTTLEYFIKHLHVTQEYIDLLMKSVLEEWKNRQNEMNNKKENIDLKITELQTSARLIADKIHMLNSETAIRYMEEDLSKIEKEVAQLNKQRTEKVVESINMEEVIDTVKYFLEHIEELLLEGSDTEKKAALFGLIFTDPPTYQELSSGTPQLEPFISLKDSFAGSHFPLVSEKFSPRTTRRLYNTSGILR